MTVYEFERFIYHFKEKVNEMKYERVSKLEYFLPNIARHVMLEHCGVEEYLKFNIINDDPICPEFELEALVEGELEIVNIKIN